MFGKHLCFVAGTALLVTGCSDQDASRVRTVGGKVWNRAAAFAGETADKLKASVHPLPRAAPAAGEEQPGEAP